MLNSQLRTAFLAAALAWPAAAMAGPCSDDIAQLTRQLGAEPGLGAPLSGTASGGSAQQAQAAQPAAASDRAQAGGASKTGGGSAGTVGGVSGAAGGEKDAVASGQVATSDQDVRSQSVGKPTAAQTASGGMAPSGSAGTDKVSAAKMSLQNAVDLNARGDSSCAAAVSKTRALMK